MIISFQAAYAQDSASNGTYIYFPKEYAAWQFESSLGISLAKMPIEVTEEEINQSPMIEAAVRLGLPWDFSLMSRINTNYITNHFLLGLSWSYTYRKFSASFGNDIAYWMGNFNFDFEGFDLRGRGTISYSHLTAGLDFDDFLLSFRAELQNAFNLTYVGEEVLGASRKDNSGYAFTFLIEQPLWHNNWVIIGGRVTYATFFYQSWISFSTYEDYLLYPEFIFGFIL